MLVAFLGHVYLHMRPPSAMPSSLSAALLRTGGLDAKASEALRRRHALLLASARVVPVPEAAFPRGVRQEEGQVEEQQGLGASRGGNQGA